MLRPDIKSYHQMWRERRFIISPLAYCHYFLGYSPMDMRLGKKKLKTKVKKKDKFFKS